MSDCTITKDKTGKSKHDRYRIVLPKDLAAEFVEKNGRKVTVRKFGDNRIIIEPKE